jgi:NTE family protein
LTAFITERIITMAIARRILGLTGLILLGLCAFAWAEVQPSASPHPKVGLALSGGGARGLAHIGVLEVLEEAGVPVDVIAGTSMGSIVGGLYSAGYRTEQIRGMVSQVDWQDAFSSTPARDLLSFSQKEESQRPMLEVGLDGSGVKLPSGLLSGYKLTVLLTRLTLPVAGVEDFDRLATPFRAVATDLVSGEAVVLGRGSLGMAMRASMSLPGVFPPFELDGRLLIDGGVVQNLPVQTVKDMGAGLTVAVNVSTPLRTRENLQNVLQVMDQTISLQMVLSTQAQAKQADLLIEPDLEGFSNSDFEKAEELRLRGRRAALAALPQILALLERRGVALAQPQRPGLTQITKIVVGGVRVQGPQAYWGEVERLAPLHEGQEVSTDQLDKAAQKIYGQGMFQSVSYRLIPMDDGRSQVVFILDEKNYGKYVSKFGMYLEGTTERSNIASFYLNFRQPNILFTGSYAELDMQAGRTLGGAARLMLPNRPWDGLFFQPEGFYYSTTHNIYANKDIRAEYMQNSGGINLEVGQELGTWGQLRLGYVLRLDSASPRIATVPVPEESDLVSAARAVLRTDTLDRFPYPRRGFKSELTALRALSYLGSDIDFTRITWEGSWVWPLGPAGYLIPNWTLATSLDQSPSFTQTMFLGGYPGLLGTVSDEFRGQEIMRVQLMHRFPLSENMHWLTAVNMGSASDSVDQVLQPDRWFWGGGTGLGLATPLGPVELLVGFGEEGRVAAYVVFGLPH